ncbi:hypothetical protein ES703_96650 [subsurface metagenome]
MVPLSNFFPGRVISIPSPCNLFSFCNFSISTSFVLSSSSISLLVWFNNCPAFGLSSRESVPSFLNRRVNDPFLPKYSTLNFSISFKSLTIFNLDKTSFLISFILFSNSIPSSSLIISRK